MYLQFVMPQNIFLIKYNVPHAGYKILDEDILKSPILDFPSLTHLLVSFYILDLGKFQFKSLILYFSAIIESLVLQLFCRSLNNNSFSGPIPNSMVIFLSFAGWILLTTSLVDPFLLLLGTYLVLIC